MNKPRAWATGVEQNWLNRIGQTHEQTRLMSRAVLLRRYIEAAEKRRDWGAMNRKQVLTHAYCLLLETALEADGHA